VEISAKELDWDATYKLLVGIVVPRPIAWITSVSPAGIVNVAPFSCYTFACNEPPMLAINIGRRHGALKDTARNIEASREFVVNVVPTDAIGPMHASSASSAAEVSEVAALGLETQASTDVRVPRLSCSPINLECRLDRILELGKKRDYLVLAEIVRFHIRDDLYAGGKVDVLGFRPLARLGGPNYAALGQMITMPPASLPDRSQGIVAGQGG
jgi:flavin reductase (DIM6/NTAB) family NADH-FMN oxidoreductase RutF